MNIRRKLSLQYTGLMSVLFISFTLLIYFFTSVYREREFYRTLHQRAITTAHMYLEEDEFPEDVMERVRQRYFQTLPTEWLKMYDIHNNPAFIPDTTGIVLSAEKLKQIRQQMHLNFRQNGRQATAIFYHDNQGDFVIVASAIDIHGLDMLHNLRLILIFSLVGMLLLVLIAANYFAKQALTPIAALNREAAGITAENLDQRLYTSNEKDEIGQLTLTFNKMLDRLEATFNMQRSFIANASHELRTPLTAMTGDIEVALMKDREKEEYKQVLNQLLDDTIRLTGISNSLLELAQASYDINRLKQEIYDGREILLHVLDEIKRSVPNGNIDFQWMAVKQVFIRGNFKLLVIAFQNIIENALKFSREKVIINAEASNDTLLITIIDKGIGISKTDMKHIFEPFFRAGNVGKVSGHGIGLSLAEKIIQLHEGNISISSVENKGTTVNVRLPAESTG